MGVATGQIKQSEIGSKNEERRDAAKIKSQNELLGSSKPESGLGEILSFDIFDSSAEFIGLADSPAEAAGVSKTVEVPKEAGYKEVVAFKASSSPYGDPEKADNMVCMQRETGSFRGTPAELVEQMLTLNDGLTDAQKQADKTSPKLASSIVPATEHGKKRVDNAATRFQKAMAEKRLAYEQRERHQKLLITAMNKSNELTAENAKLKTKLEEEESRVKDLSARVTQLETELKMAQDIEVDIGPAVRNFTAQIQAQVEAEGKQRVDELKREFMRVEAILDCTGNCEKADELRFDFANTMATIEKHQKKWAVEKTEAILSAEVAKVWLLSTFPASGDDLQNVETAAKTPILEDETKYEGPLTRGKKRWSQTLAAQNDSSNTVEISEQASVGNKADTASVEEAPAPPTKRRRLVSGRELKSLNSRKE